MGDYAQSYTPQELAQYPDFQADWQKIQQQQAVQSSSMTEQLGRGFSRGLMGLEASGAGALALASDTVGAQGAKDYWLDVYKRKVQQTAEEAPASVPTIQQATASLPAAGQYLAGKVGELVPNIGEALTFAAAGSAVAPGPGTEAGAAAGFFGRAAARSWLSLAIKKTLTAAERASLEEYAAGKVGVDALSKAAQGVVKEAASHMASVANFATIGAGGAYGELSGREGVKPEDAKVGALIAGAGASLGALIPARLIHGIFGEKASTEAVRTWIDSKAVTVPKELLIAGSGMGAMEFFNILGEKYADPRKRDEDFTRDDWSRILNSAAVGVIAGLLAGALAALRKAGTAKEVTPEAEPPPAPEAEAEGTPPPPAAPEAPDVTAGAPPPRTDPIMESRRLLLEAQKKAAAEIRIESKKVTVPATDAEERLTVTEEIRNNEAKTVREIQELFPKAQLSREQARELRDAAWGKADKVIVEAYGTAGADRQMVFLDLANKEINGTLTKSDRDYIYRLSPGEKEQYKFIREGVEDATQSRQVESDVQRQRVGDNALVQEKAQDRVKPTEQQKESAQASAGNRILQAADELTDENKAALKLAGITPESLAAAVETPKTAIKQVTEPATFGSVKDLLEFRETRLREERDLYKEQIGLSDEDAATLQRLLREEKSLDKFEKKLTPDQRAKLSAFFDGPFNQKSGPFKSWESDNKVDPSQVALETDREELSRTLVETVDRGIEEASNNDRFLSAVIAARRLKELGATKSDVAKYLDKYTTHNSASRGDKTEFFKSLGEKVNAFLDRQGVDLPQGDLGAKVKSAAIAKALSEEPKAGKKVEQKAPVTETPPPPVAPAPVEAGAATPWLEKVPDAYNAYFEPVAGKEEVAFYGRHGASNVKAEGNNKEPTNSMGVFESPSGTIVVATLKQTGKPRVNRVQTSTEGAQSWGDAIKAGWKPIGVIRTGDTKQAKVFHEYSKEQWSEIKPQLEAKTKAGKEAVVDVPVPSKAEVVEAGLRGTGGNPSDTGKGKLSREDAGIMVDQVVAAAKGIPADPYRAKEHLSDVLLNNKSLRERIMAIGGKHDTSVYLELFDRYEAAVKKFKDSGSTDPGEFRSGIVAALEGLSAKESRARTESVEAVPEELRYEGELGEGGPEVPPEEQGPEHLATTDIGRDRDASSATQSAVRSILQAHDGGSAHRALDALLKAGLISDDLRSLAEDFLNFGDRGTGLAIGGEYATRQGVSAYGKYSGLTHSISVFNKAFRDGASIRAFLHEYAHALTVGEIESGRYQSEIKPLFDVAMEKAKEKGVAPYGITTYEEFIAEAFTNRDFQAFLRASSSPSGSLWDRFVNFIGRIFGVRDRTLLDDVLRLGRKIAGPTIQPRIQVPESAQTMQWHTPVNVPKSMAESYNPVTGTVENAPLIQDSVEAAMLNIQRSDPLEFLLPAGTNGPIPTVDPVTRMNNEAGINNGIEALRRLASQAAGISLKAFQTLLGLHSTETVRERQVNEAHVKNIQGFKRDQNIDDLKNKENVDYTNVGLASALEGELSKVSRRQAAAKELDPKLKATQHKLLTENQEILDNFKDAEFMSGVIKKGVKKLLYEDIRDLERVGKAVGAAFQQYQNIEGKIGQPIDPGTVAAMRRLYTGDALQGEKMFNFLNELANDPSIDFTRPASEIRAYIRHAAELDLTLQRYGQLAADTQDAKALLSTVIAFGKLNQREVAMLQARRMESGTAREQLIQELKDQRKETNEQILTGIRSVAKASKLEEAAKLENRKALRLITRVNRNVEHNDRILSVADAAIPFYRNEIEKLTGKIQQRGDAVFTSGMQMRVPVTMDPRPKWEMRTVNLNPTKGPVTTPDQLRSAVGNMVGWMKLREQAAQNGDETAMGSDYHGVKQQVHEIMNHEVYQPLVRETDFTAFGLTMSADGKAVGAIGLPTTGLIEQGMNKFAGDTNNIRNQADKQFGYKNSRLLGNVIDVLNEGQSWWQRKRVTSPQFVQALTDSVRGFMERGRAKEGVDREVSLDEWYAKVGPWLLAQPEFAPLIRDRMPQFMKAIRDYTESVYHSGQWVQNQIEEAGLGVKDPKLGGQIRKHIDVGLRTFQRKFSDGMRNMVHVMRAAGWSKDEARGVPGASEEWKQIGSVGSQDPAKAQAMVDKYMTDTVQKDFAFKLTHVPDESVFKTPKLDDSGTTDSARPEDVAQAYDESGGDLIQMFQKLHDVYNGQEAVWSYVQSGLLRIAAVYHEIDNALKKIEPKGNVDVADIEGMVPNFMIDARQFQHLPADWFTYHNFDRNDIARIAERVAWQKNFGRDGQRFAGWYATAQEEVKLMTSKLEDALRQAERLSHNSRAKEIDASAARVLAADKDPLLAQFKTGADRLRYLRKVKSRSHFLDNLLPNLHTLFNRGNQEEGSLRWGIRVAGELASLLVNRPGAAIGQFATTFDILAKWGLSPTTLQATGSAMKMTGKDIAGSLAQAVGWEFMKASYYEKRLNEMHLNDPEVARRMGDINNTLTGEEHSPVSKFFRKAKELQSATVNLVGEKAQYTPLRPLAPFFQMVTSTNRGLFVALSNMADGFITKGMEHLESNPGTDKLTADMLGLKGENKRSFELWEADHRRYGLDFTQMAKGALERKQNGDSTVLTNKELERIFSVGLNVISLESNVATMPLWAFNNSLVRFGLPLLGWSFRRAVQVPGLTLDANDQRSLKAVRSGLMGMAAVGLGGLGLSLVVDAYSEDVLGKKRNLRGLRIPVTGNDWVGLQERLNRVGTFGMWGELINSAVNVGTGQGDNRMLSVDQRVITMQAFQALLKASANFINQDFDPDYRNVVRPAISAIGAGGMLEYMQIMNHAFDFDNVESRVVKRINAENYLRVTGRDLGMSIRSGGGGYNTPTPITPWIARMEYAAYANDPSEFREMYQGAIAEAKKAGKADAADYVKRAFETRHPLRYVFSPVPSERDYRQILGNLDDRGQESVSGAVRLFNYYGAHIGLTPFAGSKKKDAQRAANPASAARAREMALGY